PLALAAVRGLDDGRNDEIGGGRDEVGHTEDLYVAGITSILTFGPIFGARGGRPRSRSGLGSEIGDDVAAALLVAGHLEQATRAGILEELGEGAVAVVALLEVRALPLDDLLDHRAEEVPLAILEERLDRVEHQL